MLNFIFSILVMVGLCCFETAKADGTTSGSPKVIAIQPIHHTLGDEITVQAGYLPLDSFNRYYSLGATYTHFYDGGIAWEILNIDDAINVSTGLQQQLQSQFTVDTKQFDTLDYYGTTNIVYTPFYTKNVLMNSSIVRGETSFVGGVGISKFESGMTNCADLGAIFRFFLQEKISLKLDFRGFFYFSGVSRTNLVIAAGLSYNFNAPPPADASDDKPDGEDDD